MPPATPTLPAAPTQERAGGILTIDLDAIAANWRALAARVAPAGCAGVVKADGYGLGAAEVGGALAAAGCTRFFVATLDEGMRLRRALPGAEILILDGPFPGTAPDFLENGLLPVLNAPEQVAEWEALARRLDRPLPAALHLDTGMSRLGLASEDAIALAADTARLARIAPMLVMTHLACADLPDHPLNRQQLERFQTLHALFPGTAGSIAASSGIFLGSGYHADWVRPGAALFGVNPTPGEANPMRQVLRLQGKIVQTRKIDAGVPVGYGATWSPAAPARLAVVGAGYADGLSRALGDRTRANRGSALLEGHRVPLVGRVSMDLMVFDVSGVPEEIARCGALIELIGPGLPVDEVAAAAGTIGYEILTNLGRRFHRIYVGGNG